MTIPGFDQAQADYDNQEPPEVKECWACDGTRLVLGEVKRYQDCKGEWHSCHLTTNIPCPVCRGGPEPDA